MASAVAVQWAHEIAAEMASDDVKAMALAMGLTKSFGASILEQVITLETGELRHRLLCAIRPVRFLRRTKIAPPIYSAELL